MTYPVMVIPDPLERVLWRLKMNYRLARHNAPENVRRRARYKSKAKWRKGRVVKSLDELYAHVPAEKVAPWLARSYEQTQPKHDPLKWAWFDEFETLNSSPSKKWRGIFLFSLLKSARHLCYNSAYGKSNT